MVWEETYAQLLSGVGALWPRGSTAICYNSPVWQADTLLPQALCSCWFELYGIAILYRLKRVRYQQFHLGQWVSFALCQEPRPHPQISPILQAHFCSLSSRAAILHLQLGRCICLLRADRTEDHRPGSLDNGNWSSLQSGGWNFEAKDVPHPCYRWSSSPWEIVWSFLYSHIFNLLSL